MVFDSGDDFEQIIAAQLPDEFNSNNDENNSFDDRSDDKGPEPEAVVTGVIDGRTFAFIGLERVGGIMVYEISDPDNPEFVQYINNRDFDGDAEAGTAGDLGPEGLVFISAEDSPNDQPLLVVANEVSGSTTIYEIDVNVPQLNRLPNDLFSIGGDQAQLSFSINGRDTEVVSEIGVYVVDNAEGSVDGLSPGDEGYVEAALSRGQVVFSVLPDGLGSENPDRLLTGFEDDSVLGFYLVRNGTTTSVLTGETETSEVLFASPNFNSDDTDFVDISLAQGGGFSFEWRDSADGEFDDIQLQVQAVSDQTLPIGAQLQGLQQAELLDLTAFDDSQTLEITLTVNSEAEFDNLFGFYAVDDPDGSIGDLNPGDDGYAVAAFEQTVFTAALDDGETFLETSVELEGGQYLAPYIVADGADFDGDDLLDADLSVYFAYPGANPETQDHFVLLGNNLWGVEDLPGLGDADYNDVVIGATIELA